jgi:hypothetical protein
MRFADWLSIEEGDAIYDGSGDTEDYQWWGDPKSAGYDMKRPKGAKKRNKTKPDVITKKKKKGKKKHG